MKAFLPLLLAPEEAVQSDTPSGATIVNVGSLAGATRSRVASHTTLPSSGSSASARQ